MKVNQLKVGALLSYISIGLGFVIALVYTPVMLRVLGQSEYGLYNLVSSVISYLGLLNFGFGSAYLRYYSMYKAEEDSINIAKVNGMFMLIFSVVAIIALVAGLILSLYIDVIFAAKLTTSELAKAKILMIIMAINTAASFPNIVFSTYITANERFIFQKILEIIRLIMSPFIMLPIILLGYGSVGMAIATTILSLMVQATNIFYSVYKLNMIFSFQGLKFSMLKEMFVFSSFIFLHMITDQIQWNVDKLILGILWGTATVAVYSIGALFNTYYLSFSNAISNVFVPRVNNIVFTQDEITANNSLTDLMIRVGRIQLFVVVLVMFGIIFFGQEFIIMWAGTAYAEAYYIAVILIVPVTLPLIQNIGIAIQRAKNMQKFLALVNGAIAVLNIIISIPLAKMYGGIGSAIGTSIAMIIGHIIITNWYYHYRIGLDMKKFWLNIVGILPPFIIPTLLGIVIATYGNLYVIKNFTFLVLLFTVVYVISIYRFAMNESEREMISMPMKKIKNKIQHIAMR